MLLLQLSYILQLLFRWVVLKRRVGAVTSQRVLNVLFYLNILQCFFVVDNFTANAVSVAIGDNGNRLIFEIDKKSLSKASLINFIHIKQSYRMQYIFVPLNLGLCFCSSYLPLNLDSLTVI
jgi:hypothetical protein